MPRARRTDPDQALVDAMNLFWTNGYGAVGTRQIEEETGITRFTLQTTFGGKRGLLLAALDHYLDLFESFLVPPQGNASLDDLVAWFEARIATDPSDMSKARGCFAVAMFMEFAASDEDIIARRDRHVAILREGFAIWLRKLWEGGAVALADGEIADKAELLTGAALALVVHTRATGDYDAAGPLVHSTAQMIREWAVSGP